jgi:D-alanyl-D-alanine carboxypeptidase
VRRDEKHIVAVVLGGTSNGARDARMRQLIEAHISQASTQGDALQDRADVVAVAPATPDARRPAAGPSGAAAAGAKADPVPVPRPRVQAAKLAARASKRAATAQALAARGQRLTAKASTLGVLQDSPALRQTRHVERKVAPSAPLQ